MGRLKKTFAEDSGHVFFHRQNAEDSNSPNNAAEFIMSKRNKVLDDALFAFFTKEAVKSLKRNFTSFCKENPLMSEKKRCKGDSVDSCVFTRFSVKYFFDVLSKLNPYQRNVITKFGFGCLLMAENCEIPSEFVQWIAHHVDTITSEIVLDDKRVIPIRKESVHFVLGLPVDGIEIISDSAAGRKFIFSQFQLTSLPDITFFGDKLKGLEDISDEDIFVCFMIIAVSCFLCPNSNLRTNTEFLSVFQDPEKAQGFDFCKLVYDCLMLSISKLNKKGKVTGRKPKIRGFCKYFLAIYYLDFLEFGIQTIEQTIPRILVWKGNMIKYFSELDQRSFHVFGRRPVKHISATCYQHTAPASDKAGLSSDSGLKGLSSPFSHNIHSRFGLDLRAEVIDGIFDIFQTILTTKEDINDSKSELFVTNILQFLSQTRTVLNSDGSKGVEPCVVDCKGFPAAQNKTEYVPTVQRSTSKLDCPEDYKFSSNLKDNNQDFHLLSKNLGEPVTPDCAITKIIESCSIRTAQVPQILPKKKVKSRICNFVSREELAFLDGNHTSFRTLDPKIGNEKDFHDVMNELSPVAALNLSPASYRKEGIVIRKLEDLSIPNTKLPITTKRVPIPNNSPDVEIVGARDFSVRCNQLSKETDIAYNSKMYSAIPEDNSFNDQLKAKPLSTSQARLSNIESQDNDNGVPSRVKEVVHDQRRVNFLPKCTSGPSSDKNKRFPVSDDDRRNYTAIIKLGQTTTYQKQYAIIYTRVHCSYESLGESMMPEGHVDNFLLPCFCRKLFEDCHPKISGKHHFFSYIGETILKYKHSQDQKDLIFKSFHGAGKASKGGTLKSSNMLFFPICHGEHWFLFVVHLKYHLFAFLDSLYDYDSEYHAEVRTPLIDNFVLLWEEMVDPQYNFANYRIMYPTVPRQHNVDDCGVYVMKFMEIWDPRINLKDYFTRDDIPNIRIQYANQLYFCDKNEVDKSLVTNYYAGGGFHHVGH